MVFIFSVYKWEAKKKKQWKNIHNFKEIITLISVYVAGELYSIPSQTSKTGVTVEYDCILRLAMSRELYSL